MIDRFVDALSSLRLTLVGLACALILDFAGTLAQVRLGLYEVQSKFFHSFFVYWTPPGSQWHIPVLPGGWLIGLVLVANLLAGHVKRFQFSRRKAGILLVHAGLILLLLGQFVTECYQIESQMRLEIGETKNYAEDNRRNELAVIDVTNPEHDEVVAIPQALLEKQGEIRLPGKPFVLRVKKFLANSLPAGPMSGAGEKLKAQNGLGQRLLFTAAPTVSRMDDENKPAALVEVATDKGALGQWTVSTWMSKRPWASVLQGEVGGLLGVNVSAPQSFNLDGHTYQLVLRAVRYYKPYSITLLDFRHDVYAGTDIPSNFSSKIHLSDPSRGEDRDILIYMNNPLRYRGESFYQASFEPGDKVSVLQVVRNPASIMPYVACSLVALGLVVQFLMHLLGFAKKQARPVTPLAASANGGGPGVATVLAAAGGNSL